MRAIEDSVPTRASLLSRLKKADDQESWKEFFDTHWRIIYASAIKAGLSETEAQDVVQDTVLCVVKSIPGFKYDPAVGSFKSWLRKLTRWRVIDQMRRRSRDPLSLAPYPRETAIDLATLPDESDHSFENWWDEEWKRTMMQVALDRTKDKIDSKQFQIFDLHVLREWPVRQVAAALKINPAKIYLAKHRVNKVLKAELRILLTDRKI
jgi:RNA polymerase sigma factor (sigma-70 family)